MTKYIKLNKNKGIEIEIDFSSWDWVLFDLSFRIDRKVDHAGIHFTFQVYCFRVSIDAQDNRHWYHEMNRWFKPGEEEAYMEVYN